MRWIAAGRSAEFAVSEDDWDLGPHERLVPPCRWQLAVFEDGGDGALRLADRSPGPFAATVLSDGEDGRAVLCACVATSAGRELTHAFAVGCGRARACE